jgi:hypothetical protein
VFWIDASKKCEKMLKTTRTHRSLSFRETSQACCGSRHLVIKFDLNWVAFNKIFECDLFWSRVHVTSLVNQLSNTGVSDLDILSDISHRLHVFIIVKIYKRSVGRLENISNRASVLKIKSYRSSYFFEN